MKRCANCFFGLVPFYGGTLGASQLGAWQGVWAYFNTGTDQTRRACETLPSAGKPGQTSHAKRRTETQRSTVTLHYAEWAESPVAQKWNYRQNSLYLLIWMVSSHLNSSFFRIKSLFVVVLYFSLMLTKAGFTWSQTIYNNNFVK